MLVTPPDANAEGLQGLACFDPKRMQVRVLFGGATGSAEVVIRGFESISLLSGTVLVMVWETEPTGFAPSSGPKLKLQGMYPITDGQVPIRLTEVAHTSTYQIILFPTSANKEFSSGDRGFYLAQDADLSEDGILTFVVTASDNEFYNIKLRYAAPMRDAVATLTLGILWNGEPLPSISVPTTRAFDSLMEASFTVFLRAVINRRMLQTLTEFKLCSRKCYPDIWQTMLRCCILFSCSSKFASNSTRQL